MSRLLIHPLLVSLCLLASACGGDSNDSSKRSATDNDGSNTAASQPAERCGGHPWCDPAMAPETRAHMIMAEMSMFEKASMMSVEGVPAQYEFPGIERLNIPKIVFRNGPAGVKGGIIGGAPATLLPAPLAIAGSFDPELTRLSGDLVGREMIVSGYDALLGPASDVLRIEQNGRSFESYGEDPLLQSKMVVPFIQALQAHGVPSILKHYVVNNQEGGPIGTELVSEILGMDPLIGAGAPGSRFTVDAVIDERTFREIYLPPFEAAVKEAHVASMMASYNRVNGTWVTENSVLLRDVLKRDLGFDGFVISDSGALHLTVQAANAGTDMEAPWRAVFRPELLTAANATGLIPDAVINEAAYRILYTMFRFGFFDREAYTPGPVDADAGYEVARKLAEESTVLLRNNGILPLSDSLTSIAVIGDRALEHPSGGGSSDVDAAKRDNVLDAITQRAGDSMDVRYDDGGNAAAVAAAADVAIVVVADIRTEGEDRLCLTLDCLGTQDAMINEVAAANPNTIVVMLVGGPVLTPWREQVAAILLPWYPGEAGGAAVANILFGDVNPSGHLAATLMNSADDTATANDPMAYPGLVETATYKEGVFVGYRHYDANAIDVAYPFGFGLSYTEFAFSNLQINGSGSDYEVSVTVKNIGERKGKAVAQLYLGLPSQDGVPQPPKQLKGFGKIELAPGQSGTVSMPLSARDFSYWNSSTQSWDIVLGCHQVMVGDSSRNLPLSDQIVQGEASCS